MYIYIYNFPKEQLNNLLVVSATKCGIYEKNFIKQFEVNMNMKDILKELCKFGSFYTHEGNGIFYNIETFENDATDYIVIYNCGNNNKLVNHVKKMTV